MNYNTNPDLKKVRYGVLRVKPLLQKHFICFDPLDPTVEQMYAFKVSNSKVSQLLSGACPFSFNTQPNYLNFSEQDLKTIQSKIYCAKFTEWNRFFIMPFCNLVDEHEEVEGDS